MALFPLLLAGAGIMSGAQFLMNKGDERETNTLLDQFMPQIPGMFGQVMNPAYQRAAEDLQKPRTGMDFFGDPKAGDARDLLAQYRQDTASAMQWEQSQAVAQQQRWNTSNEGRLTTLQGRRAENDSRFGEVQSQMNTLKALYRPGSTGHVDLQGMINAVARLQFPGEATNQGDVDGIINSSTLLSRWMNEAKKATGGAADDNLAADIYNFAQRFYKGQKASFEAGERNIEEALNVHRQEGFLPGERAESRYGLYDPQFDPGGMSEVPQYLEKPNTGAANEAENAMLRQQVKQLQEMLNGNSIDPFVPIGE